MRNQKKNDDEEKYKKTDKGSDRKRAATSERRALDKCRLGEIATESNTIVRQIRQEQKQLSNDFKDPKKSGRKEGKKLTLYVSTSVQKKSISH